MPECGGEALGVGVDLAGDAEAFVVGGVDADEGAEEPIPDGEDAAVVVLGCGGDVVAAMESRCDEDWFEPAQVDAEVAERLEVGVERHRLAVEIEHGQAKAQADIVIGRAGGKRDAR